MSGVAGADGVAGAPDFAEPLLGFRGWTIQKEGRLAPATGGPSWTTGVNRAVCMRLWPGKRKHEPPHQGCGCGFNAFHRPDMPELARMPIYVVGAIAAWGDVDVYRTGFRAQFACIVALSYRGSTTIEQYRHLQRAAERYEVRLVEAPDLVEEGGRYASAVAPATLPSLPAAKPSPPPARTPTPRQPRKPRRPRTGGSPRKRARRASKPPPQPVTPGTSSIANVAGPASGRKVPGTDLPPWALGETGYRLRTHLGIAVKGLTADVCLTPAYLAVIGKPKSIRFTAPGTKVAGDDVLAVIATDLGRFVVRAPFDGEVTEVNIASATGLRPASATGPRPKLSPGDWLVRVESTDADIGVGTAVWGEDGWNSYRRYVGARDDARIRAELALEAHTPTRATEDGSPDLGSAAGVRWLAGVLDPQLAADEALQSAIAEREIGLAFWVPELSAGMVVSMQRPDRPMITFTDSEPDTPLTLVLGPDTLHEYWTGELDLAAATGDRVTLRGPRDEALRATALLRRLCPAHLERMTVIREAGRQGRRALTSPPAQHRRAA